MKKDKRLIVRLIGVLSIVATTSMATPAYAMSGADYTSRGKTTVYSGATSQASQSTTKSASTQASVQSAQQQLVYGFNAINNDPNQIYFANAQGVKQTGWIKSEIGWYYANPDGVLQHSKWIQDSSAWYYIGANGEMLTNYIVDGYYVNKSGAWTTAPSGNVRTYSTVSIANKTISVKDFEAGIANGTIKAKVMRNSSTIGATQQGQGVLSFYFAN